MPSSAGALASGNIGTKGPMGTRGALGFTNVMKFEVVWVVGNSVY